MGLPAAAREGSSPAGTPLVINFAFHDGRYPAHGFEASRDAAMEAFTRCWFGTDLLDGN